MKCANETVTVELKNGELHPAHAVNPNLAFPKAKATASKNAKHIIL